MQPELPWKDILENMIRRINIFVILAPIKDILRVRFRGNRRRYVLCGDRRRRYLGGFGRDGRRTYEIGQK